MKSDIGRIVFIIFMGLLGIFFFYMAIVSIDEAIFNKEGGYIPIYARNGDEREEVGEDWINSKDYKHYKKREAIENMIYGALCFCGVVYMCCGNKREEQQYI